MSIPVLPIKDAYDIVPYSADFSSFLETGDTISSAVVVIAPTGLSAGAPVIVNSVVTVFVSGGTDNVAYTVSYEIVSTAGWHVKRSGIIPVRDR